MGVDTYGYLWQFTVHFTAVGPVGLWAWHCFDNGFVMWRWIYSFNLATIIVIILIVVILLMLSPRAVPAPLSSCPGRAVALASSESSAWCNRGQASRSYCEIVHEGLSENRLNPYTQWLMIIIPMKNGYFIGKINPTCSDKPMKSHDWTWHLLRYAPLLGDGIPWRLLP